MKSYRCSKKKMKIQTLEKGDRVKSDMSLRQCSTRKIKKMKNKKRRTTAINNKDMVSLLKDFKLGRFLRKKKKKNKKPPTCFPLSPPQQGKIKEGDTVDMSELLFTKDRDFLITYTDRNHPVRAKHLKGKVIVLHFVPLGPLYQVHMRYDTTILLDVCHELQPKGGFEVVFVGVPVETSYTPANLDDDIDEQFSTLEECFEFKFSIMPWTAIPFADIESRKLLETRFPLSGYVTYDSSTSFIIDPAGKVLNCYADGLFESYGARAYPFTDERLKCIYSEDEEARKRPSITKLLASHERDFLINKDNQAVPLRNLEDKVVGLYFYNGGDYHLTKTILKAYKQLVQVKNFEIVLVYIHDASMHFEHTSEKSYWRSFRKMPWLALPYKDPVCKRLQTVFNYPGYSDTDVSDQNPNLLFVGPQGKFVERYGAPIIMQYGISAYLFTCEKVAELEAKKMKEHNLMKLCAHLDIPLIRIDGSTVQLSQLTGKRIILIAEQPGRKIPYFEFWRMLRARYLQMKGTNDEFEVIHICIKEGYSFCENIATAPWLRYPANCKGSNAYWPLK